MGTNYFVDSTNGDDTDDGTTMDDGPGAGVGCWATIEHAVEAGGLVAGDIVWVRRIHVEYSGPPTSYLQPAYSGTPKEPIRVIGWPRNTHAVASSDWTNGSTGVVIDDADMDREKHCGRFITGPDGFDYLITKVTDASNIVIDREYAGGTLADQAATIKADEDYALAQTINDAAWTIKKADYNADADDIPCIDFQNSVYMLYIASKYNWRWGNLEFRDTQYNSGLFYLSYARVVNFRGCLFHQDQPKYMGRVNLGTQARFLRCIFDGASGGALQGLHFEYGDAVIKDSALFGVAGDGIFAVGCRVFCENFNIGVESNNGNGEFVLYHGTEISGRDVKLGGSNGYVRYSLSAPNCRASFENYGKVLGAHKTFTPQGEITKVAAGGGGDVANMRAGGAANLIEILNDLANTSTDFPEPFSDWEEPFFVHEFEANTDSKSYRYYVQSMAIVTAAQLWIEVEYVAEYDDDTEYIISKQISDEAFTVRADADDWAEYMEVTGIQPAVASKVRIKCYCSYQHASNKIYVDPKVIIS